LSVIWLYGGYVADFDCGACQCVVVGGGSFGVDGGLSRSIVRQTDGVGLPNSFGVSFSEASRLLPEEPASAHLFLS
jgi:hypothetical protein